MPVKNSGRFLEKTLNSILDQTFSDWELCAIDDGSTDNSRIILEDYASADERIKVFDNGFGKGIIPALRTAYSKSRGPVITRMDSDDLMEKNKLFSLLKILTDAGKNYVACGLVSCFSDLGVKDGYRKYESWLNGVLSSSDPYGEIYRECVIQSSCWMIFREDLIRSEAFLPSVYPEDYDLCFRFYKYGIKPVVCKEVLHYWRDHPDRVSRNDPAYSDQQFFDLKLKYFFEIERDRTKKLAVWGTGKKGKKLVRKIFSGYEDDVLWITGNTKKAGGMIYGIKIKYISVINDYESYQTIVAVSSPEDLNDIEIFMASSGSVKNRDHFFFC